MCPKCAVPLQDQDTRVPWCDRCAWTPPESEGLVPEAPIDEDEDYESVDVRPERYYGEADTEHFRRTRYPEQDPAPIRRAIHNERKAPRWLRTSWRGRTVR